MSGSTIFAVVWLSMATTVYAWGAIMIVACRTLDIRPRKAFFVDEGGSFENWAFLALQVVLWLPVAAGMLAYDAVQIQREARR